MYQQESVVLVTDEEEELPSHLDCSLEHMANQIKFIAYLDGFDEVFIDKALASVDVFEGGGFPVVLPEVLH